MNIFYHIDVNSAYLSWEAAYRLSLDPSAIDLREIPAIIGGDEKKRKGIVLAKSIPAKKYKIQTGEPIRSALQKYPKLEIIPPQYSLYMKASQSMVDLISEYTPLIQRFSIDELFAQYIGPPGEHLKQAEEIRERISRELGFTVNIGVSFNKLLAKVASDFTKPDRVHPLFKEDIPVKMWPLPVGDLFMVGRRTEKKLRERGITTIGELAAMDPKYMYRWMKKPGLTIWNFANGIENSSILLDSPPYKSISNSTTMPFDVETKKDCKRVLLAISENIGNRLRGLHFNGQVLSVSFCNTDFLHYRKEEKLNFPTQNTQILYKQAEKLFSEIWKGEPLRKFSIRVSKLTSDQAKQLSLFEKEEEKYRNLETTLDHLREEYGKRSVYRSTFLHSGISPMIGGVMEEEEYLMMSSTL